MQTLSVEIYETLNDLNPTIMHDVFSVKGHNFSTRTQNLAYPNPRTISYGVETFGYKASQIWSKIPRDIQQIEDISMFKNSVSVSCKNICNCNFVSHMWQT